ncbi:MAG TPA: hypothetical protein ENN61_05310 [Bacteroidaceae bacterium]|nr:hypothetical protein [Bacteroidaceae bacterium]
MNITDDKYLSLFRDDYRQILEPYLIEVPEIKTGAVYYFKTDSGLRYEVLFAKKRDNYMGNIINFSVLNDEYDDEYSVTNRGEIYRIITTVIEIILIYHKNHPYSVSYEFSGEFKKGNEHRTTSIRTLLYYRKAKEITHPSWNIELTGNKVIVHRKRSYYGR